MKSMAFLTAAILFCLAGPAGAQTRISSDPDRNPWTHLNFRNNPDNFQFGIICDRTGGNRPGVFESGIRKLNLLQPEFVVCVGDLVEGYTEDRATIDRERDEVHALVSRFEMPFFYLAGNHDITNDIAGEKWGQRFGRAYYPFVYRNVLFLMLNCEDPHPSQISQQQLDTIRKALEDNPRVRWTMVFIHKPLWLQHPPSESRWDQVEAMLADRPVTVFSGHTHTYSYEERNGRSYYILATTGGSSNLAGVAAGRFDHVTWVTMGDRGPSVANLLVDGILDGDVRNPRTIALVTPLIQRRAVLADPIFTESRTYAGGRTTLRIANPGDLPMNVKAAFEPHALLQSAPAALNLTLPAGEKHEVILDLRARRPEPVEDLLPLTLTWTLTYDPPDRDPLKVEGKQRIAPVQPLNVPRAKRPPILDGRLDEWKTLPYRCNQPDQILPRADSWKGPKDCSFRFAAACDDSALYLAVEAIDDQQVTGRGLEDRQDGIRFRLDARPEPERSHGRNRKDEALVVTLSAGETMGQPGSESDRKGPEGVRAICRPTATGHVTEIAVPAGYLGARQGGPWSAVRLNLGVSDYDREGAGIVTWWRPEWGTDENIAGTGTFIRK